MSRNHVRLPIDDSLEELRGVVAETRRAIVIAPPGAGKSTRVPPLFLDAGVLDAACPNVWLLQPRRVAARAVAARIAEERGSEIGDEIGYQVRFERRASRETRLLVMTEGVLNRRLLSDPFLERVGAVVIDEFHERGIHADLALAMLREVRRTVREDLILIVMSATFDPGRVSRFLDDAPVIRSDGRAHPVSIRYLAVQANSRSRLADRVAEAVDEALRSDGEVGDLLVFLPGVGEIQQAARALDPISSRLRFEVVALHGGISLEAQARAIRRSSHQRVILATNVAETSITVEGVGTVIDSGLVRRASFDPARGLESLELTRASRASCDQRAGRAGRLGPGRCIRLWSERENRARPEFDPPEVATADLSATVLALRAWTGDSGLASFEWFEAPPADRAEAADQLLERLGAIEPRTGRVTELGRATLDLGIHPRLARILAIGSRAGMANEAATVAAILSEPDFLVLDEVRAVVDSLPAARSDLIFRIDRLSVAENERFAPRLRELGINPHAARSVARTRDVLRRVIERSTAGAIDPALVDAVGGLDPESALLALIFLGYPDRLARRRPNQPEVGLMVGGRGVRLDRVSLLRDDPLFVVVEGREVKRGVSEVLVTIASGVEREWLGVLAPGAVNEVDTVELDRATGRVHGFRAAHYFDLPIEEPRRSPPSEADAQRVIMEYLRSHMEEWIAGDEAMREWIGRWRFLARAVPELELPEPEIELLIEIHADIARTARGLDDLRRVPFSELARSVLSPVQYSAIEREAPAGLTLPNGRTARIHYGLDTAPRLEVRVQDLFGWRETPRIARGRVLLLLEILGPNFRPVQRTNDLAGFWAGTYQQVRKDLRARYPKHAWPENPRDAAPIVRNKPKR